MNDCRTLTVTCIAPHWANAGSATGHSYHDTWGREEGSGGSTTALWEPLLTHLYHRMPFKNTSKQLCSLVAIMTLQHHK